METESLFKALRVFEHSGDYDRKEVSEKQLRAVEKEIGCRIPEEYRACLKEFGMGDRIDGFVVLGFNDNKEPVFLRAAEDYRVFGLPEGVLVLEECEEWLYCIDIHTGEVFTWSPGNSVLNEAYDSFFDYLEGRIMEVLKARGSYGLS